MSVVYIFGVMILTYGIADAIYINKQKNKQKNKEKNDE